PGERLENAKVLLERISGGKAVMTQSKDRNPTFKIRKGDNIGAKVTLRGPEADAVLRKALDVRDFTLLESSFDKFGNVAFGIKEYIDFPGMKYDPKIGMMGFDVCVTLAKAGRRVARRKISASRIPQKQRVSREEAKDFMVTSYKVKVEVPSEE
ncbi:MAG TPA: 50S ribosomal protein L5, partial [Candidatus Norongarragalinales archaeon]|nr:50S ribosomal protein L5 [Candidatus Norongarragalinales archaeon]